MSFGVDKRIIQIDMTTAKQKSTKKSINGFTLVELMITVTVIAILAAIAVPQYREFVQHTRRSDATSSLQDVMAKQALFYGNFGGTYTSDVTKLGYDATNPSLDQMASEDKDEGRHSLYLLKLLPCDASGLRECVKIIATPNPLRSQANDSECSSFTLTSRGTQRATKQPVGGTPISNPDCWK